MDGKLNPGAPGGEGVLANFFNSLLNKKAGAPGSPGSGPMTGQSPVRQGVNGIPETPERITTRADAAAELDRLTRSVEKEKNLSSSDC